MRDNDGRKLDHHTLEEMRLRAVDAVEPGVHQRAWQADPDAVARWKTENFPAIRAQVKA
jgi:hypothetical protein